MKTVTIRNHSMAYQEHGQGNVLLLGHSYLWDSAMWKPQLEALSKNFRVIAPDLWAHGTSDLPPDGPVSIQTLAQDMLAFTQALELERFSIAGLSVGGMWGAQLSLLAPEQVESLVVMDSYVGPEPEETRLKYFGMLDTVEQVKGIPPPMQEAIVPLFFSPHTQAHQPHIVDDFRARLSSFDPARVPSIVRIGRAIFSRTSLLEELHRVNIPTLFVVGEDDLSRPPHESIEMGSLVQGSRVEVIPQAGHISSLEQPDRVNPLLNEFFSSL